MYWQLYITRRIRAKKESKRGRLKVCNEIFIILSNLGKPALKAGKATASRIQADADDFLGSDDD